MKKLLLSTAVAGLAFAATPALAEGFDVKAGGFFKGYLNFVDQDEVTGGDTVRDLDILRHTEVYVTGETTLENGLVVGVYVEGEADDSDAFEVEESYVYFQGDWGRINFGAEDGAAYLLQVTAPSADENVDGVRQFVNPFNTTAAGVNVGAALTGAAAAQIFDDEGFDYDQDLSRDEVNKLTYLTPVFSGFQAGVSYTPELDEESGEGAFDGSSLDDENGTEPFGDVVEVSARFEGEFDGFGLTLGAGFATASLEDEPAAAGTLNVTDDRTQFNVAGSINTAGFTLAVSYSEDDYGELDDDGTDTFQGDDEETIVVGASYETGPFKLGASYLSKENTFGIQDFDTTRYAGGVVYTYAPGLSFRGSIGFQEHEDAPGTTDDVDATYVLLGTQVNF